MPSEKRTLRHGRLILVLDRSQVFPDDPGEGTPAIVKAFGYSATYWCACGEGRLFKDGGSEETELTTEELNWLDEQDPALTEFLYR